MYKYDKLSFIMNDPENRYCFDCKLPNPTHCSVNNGVLLCSLCADKHLKLNQQITVIKSLIDDTWTENELRFLEISGNKRFASMMHEYNIPLEKPFDFKYSTIAAYYYRRLVYSEVIGSQPPAKPDISAGLKLMTEDMLKEPTFFQNLKEKISYAGEVIADKTKQAYEATKNVFTGKKAEHL
jgi:hypothetical protein